MVPDAKKVKVCETPSAAEPEQQSAVAPIQQETETAGTTAEEPACAAVAAVEASDAVAAVAAVEASDAVAAVAAVAASDAVAAVAAVAAVEASDAVAAVVAVAASDAVPVAAVEAAPAAELPEVALGFKVFKGGAACFDYFHHLLVTLTKDQDLNEVTEGRTQHIRMYHRALPEI